MKMEFHNGGVDDSSSCGNGIGGSPDGDYGRNIAVTNNLFSLLPPLPILKTHFIIFIEFNKTKNIIN